MPISQSIAGQLEQASWIRRMFEIGIELRRSRGAENVFDFSLGNPEVEPPAAVIGALRRVVAENLPHTHGYMPNAGYPEVRAQLARRLAASTGLPFAAEHLIMTSGAAGAINTVLKSILDPGDEVIVLNPYFPEYRFYIENHGGRFRKNARVRRSIRLQLDGEIRKKQVMVDDDDVALHRLAPHFGNEAPLPLAALLPNASVGACVELVPQQAGLGQFRQLGAVPRSSRLLPGSDSAILLDLLQSAQHGLIRQLV